MPHIMLNVVEDVADDMEQTKTKCQMLRYLRIYFLKKDKCHSHRLFKEGTTLLIKEDQKTMGKK